MGNGVPDMTCAPNPKRFAHRFIGRGIAIEIQRDNAAATLPKVRTKGHGVAGLDGAACEHIAGYACGLPLQRATADCANLAVGPHVHGCASVARG